MPDRKAFNLSSTQTAWFQTQTCTLIGGRSTGNQKNENDISLEQMGRKPVGKEKWSTSDRMFVSFTFQMVGPEFLS